MMWDLDRVDGMGWDVIGWGGEYKGHVKGDDVK